MKGRLDKKAVKLMLPPTSSFKRDSYVYMSANIAVIDNGTIKYTPAVKGIAGALTQDQLSQWQAYRSDELEKECNVECENVFYCPQLDGCHCLIIKSRHTGQYWIAQINGNQAFPPSTDQQSYLDEFIFLKASSFFNNPENAYAAFFAKDTSKI